MSEYAVTIYVEVQNEAALFEAARTKLLAEAGGDEGTVRDILPDVSAALRWLLDPGVSPPGCEIHDCTCDDVG